MHLATTCTRLPQFRSTQTALIEDAVTAHLKFSVPVQTLICLGPESRQRNVSTGSSTGGLSLPSVSLFISYFHWLKWIEATVKVTTVIIFPLGVKFINIDPDFLGKYYLFISIIL